MQRRQLSIVPAVIAVIFVTISSADSAHAAEFEAGGSADVPAGAVVDDDYYVVGGAISIAGDVTGDLFVLGGEIDVTGTVGGSVHILGGTVRIAGPVGGSVRVMSGTANIDGEIGRDVIASSGTVNLRSGAEVGGDLVVGSGSITVTGDVQRDLRGSMGSLTVNGSVGRDVRVTVDGPVRVAQGAVIVGDLNYRSPDVASIADDAEIGGEITHRQLERTDQWGLAGGVLGWVGALLLRLSWALVAGTVLVLLLPRQSREITQSLVRQPLASLLWGVGVLILTPFAMLFLFVTIIGVPAGLILLGIYILALYLSQVIVGLTLGRLMMPGSWQQDFNRWRLWVAMVVGVTIVVVIRLLPIPFGWTWVLSLGIAIVALGAIWISITGVGRSTGPGSASPAIGTD